MPGLYFEEFEVGRVFDHPIHRTITETDNVLMTTLTLSFMVGISVNDTTHGTTVANLGWDEVRFPHPLFCGDTIRIQTEVLETRPSKSRPNNGIVVFAHRAYNQDDQLVGECKRTALMLRKPA
jgi:acyl dehydratase